MNFDNETTQIFEQYDALRSKKQFEYERYWSERIDEDVPENVASAIKRVYASYPKECLPQGVCDPMYIMNVICKELGIGDGQGNFYLPEKAE